MTQPLICGIYVAFLLRWAWKLIIQEWKGHEKSLLPKSACHSAGTELKWSVVCVQWHSVIVCACIATGKCEHCHHLISDSPEKEKEFQLIPAQRWKRREYRMFKYDVQMLSVGAEWKKMTWLALIRSAAHGSQTDPKFHSHACTSIQMLTRWYIKRNKQAVWAAWAELKLYFIQEFHELQI